MVAHMRNVWGDMVGLGITLNHGYRKMGVTEHICYLFLPIGGTSSTRLKLDCAA